MTLEFGLLNRKELRQEQIKLSQRFISIIFAPFFGLKIDFNFRFCTFVLQIS
jgi:hypothetical protein